MRRAAVALTVAVAVLGALALPGCHRNAVIDFAMARAPHAAAKTTQRLGPYLLLAGDLHCHIQPPDASYHVSRELPETVRLAADEGLDFVVLTPHVPSRFFLDPEKRAWVRATQMVLRAQVEAYASNVLLVHGMEYTDWRYGHVGLAFANVDEVLDDLPADGLTLEPQLFFERWSAHGGLAILNHPTMRAIPDAPLAELRADYSWRAFTQDLPELVPGEIDWLTTHADAMEIENYAGSYLRDRWFWSDPDRSLREGSSLLEREARRQRRRIAATGGSDSHSSWLRPTTWVLATERTNAAVRDAIVAGRTCVRGPEACSLEVRGADGALHVTGASIASRAGAVEARASGGVVAYFVNGAEVAREESSALARVRVPGYCSTLHAVVNDSWSGPIYVDCPWATPR